MYVFPIMISLLSYLEDTLPVVEDKSKSIPRKMKSKGKASDDVAVRDTTMETEKSTKRKKQKKNRKSPDSSKNKNEFYGRFLLCHV